MERRASSCFLKTLLTVTFLRISVSSFTFHEVSPACATATNTHTFVHQMRKTNSVQCGNIWNHRESHCEQNLELSMSKKDNSILIEDMKKDFEVNGINEELDGFTNSNNICQVVASGDGKFPSRNLINFDEFTSTLRDKMDAIFHAESLKYYSSEDRFIEGIIEKEEEEEQMIQLLRKSLEDAGYELLNQRDLDLCEALNLGYLLRLSILPDTKDLDPLIGEEFYPEKFSKLNYGNPTLSNFEEEILHEKGEQDELLFNGRVLLFRRGYSTEVTKGRIIIPKLDYLQASVVQRTVSSLSNLYSSIERSFTYRTAMMEKKVRKLVRKSMFYLASSIPNEKLSNTTIVYFSLEHVENKETFDTIKKKHENTIRLQRYGGNKVQLFGSPDSSDALDPFLLCELTDVESTENSLKQDVKFTLNSDSFDLDAGKIYCRYDENNLSSEEKCFRLLERVSISDIVDFFSKGGRRRLIKSFFSESELIEPTYEEVIVIWRPKERPKNSLFFRPAFSIPKQIYDVAEIFGVEDRLPSKQEQREGLPTQPIQIRIFNQVPMANLLAVLPKSRLIFRPADAFVFDLISIFSLVAVLGSQRFDSPKLDIIALISVSVWLLRTVLRYSNKLARYDLLVNKFLTSKISQRGLGALRYLISEAQSQRATRASLVHQWILRKQKTTVLGAFNDLSRTHLKKDAASGLRGLIHENRSVNINIDEAFSDLEELNLLSFDDNRQKIIELKEGNKAIQTLREKWLSIFDEAKIKPTIANMMREDAVSEE